MFVCLIAALASGRVQEMALTSATGSITTSVRIKPGTYTLEDRTGHGAIRIGADGVTVDFQGATLQSPDVTRGRLETFNGIGLAIEDHKGITIRNAHIHGFQFNIKALRSSGVTLQNCEVGQSRSQKISNGDSVNNVWLDLRGLESWRGYGAGAWFEKCSKCLVSGVSANQSQNGLILVNANDCKIVGCDFSYNSGWGIAFCSSSRNLICWNHADFVNRPWSGGWGGDSSGVVLTTGSNDNIWAYNSFTHSGDGFFLATKNGGFDEKGVLHEDGTCDRNQIAYNDGSWSTANAFESTFSIQNLFYRNLANDSNYGFWLGYSNINLIEGNQIKRSHVDGIANEQGSKNLYLDNVIQDTGETAIHLWSGGGDRFKQSPSSMNVIVSNHIEKAKHAIDLTNSKFTFATENMIRDAPVPKGFSQTKVNQLAMFRKYRLERLSEIMALKPPGFKMYRDTDFPKGWQWLAATAYGMRDYRKMLVPWAMKDAKTLRLQVPPAGVPFRLTLPEWMVQMKGDAPREIFVTTKPNANPYGEYREFRIQAIAGSSKPQSIVGHLLDLTWRVRWFKWFRNDHDAYTDTQAWAALFAGPALREEDLPDLPEIPGYRSPEPGLPSHHFALVGTTKIKLAAGTYRFDTISDDGIQVLVDGRMVVSNWTHHGATNDSGQVFLSAGVHEIEVHYCQEDGGAALSVRWGKVAGG